MTKYSNEDREAEDNASFSVLDCFGGDFNDTGGAGTISNHTYTRIIIASPKG